MRELIARVSAAAHDPKRPSLIWINMCVAPCLRLIACSGKRPRFTEAPSAADTNSAADTKENNNQ